MSEQPPFQVDASTPFGARVAAHLLEDPVLWFTTVNSAGTPQPSPVWFLWDGADAVLIYSRADTPRTRNLQANPRVALHFDGDGQGGDIVVFTGTAAVAGEAGPVDQNTAYVHKYAERIAGLGMTPETFATAYPVPLLVVLRSVRGH